MFETLLEVCGLVLGELTESERGRVNRAARELRELGAGRREILPRAVEYRRRFGDRVPLTPQALTANWSTLKPKPGPKAQAELSPVDAERLARQLELQRLHDEATTWRRLLDNPLPLRQGQTETTHAWHARVRAAWLEANPHLQGASP